MGRTTLTGSQIKDDTIALGTDTSGILPINEGGTNATTAADARTNLELVAGGAGDIWVEKAGDTMTGAINSLSVIPTVDSASDLGSSSKYFANEYVDKIYLNGTAYLDGASVGVVTVSDGLTVTGTITTNTSGNIKATGGFVYARGIFDEATTTAGIYMGYGPSNDSPRFLLANGTANQNFQIDNNAGTMRFFSPSNVIMQLSTTNIIANKPISTPSNTNLSLVPNGTGYTIIGDAGTTSHSFNTNDNLLVSGNLEVDGIAYFDGNDPEISLCSLVNYGTATLNFLESATTNICRFHARSGYDQFSLGLSAPSGRQFIIAGNIDYQDFDHPTQTNPTLYIHSAVAPDTNNTQWLSLAHDQTDAVLATGTGDLKITSIVNLTESLEVDGTKVIGNRVIDARIDDAINSGDATTDGVIDALRDAMIAHGLIAAA